MFLGIEGERRKIIVSDFKWKENEAEISFEDIRDAKIEGNIKHYSLSSTQYLLTISMLYTICVIYLQSLFMWPYLRFTWTDYENSTDSFFGYQTAPFSKYLEIFPQV